MTTNRRGFLQKALGGLAACACCGPAAFAATVAKEGGTHAADTAAHRPHWSYEGEGGPQHWGDLQADFKVCSLGVEQTPIDLSGGIKAEIGTPLDLAYRPLPLRILNNGHTIQVNADPGCSCTIAGSKYDLLQFHFHHPSEHLLSGRNLDLELHFVHRSAAGNLAVVGVFFRPGAKNPGLEPIFDAMPAKEGPEVRAAAEFDPSLLLPKGGGYFRYMGSLTTPPCSEGLTWTVFKEPLEASPEQIRTFATLFVNNARPVQGLNRRLLLDVAN